MTVPPTPGSPRPRAPRSSRPEPPGPEPLCALDPRCAGRLRDWLALQLCLGLRPQHATELVRETGHPLAAIRRSGRTRPPARRIEAALRALRDCGAVALPVLSAAYPARIARLSDAPPLLLVRGEPSLLTAPCVAIVGSRAASVYGHAVARRFASELAAAGLVVVSGLANGIDGVAHRASLAAGGLTLAFQACGPERVYPRNHRSLAAAIAARGALVTEFPPGCDPRPGFFPLRNRLISGLSLALLVVEARERSGSLTTARHAADQGVEVFAVPGPIDAPTSAGTNALLRDGATPALEPRDVLERIHPASGSPLGTRIAQRVPEPADPELRRVLDALRAGPAPPDELARRLGASAERLACWLTELELAGRVRQDRDGRLRAFDSATATSLERRS